ncbi:hypothetical protein VULLAG_LOCUS2166 [Vulpes lagopus]
MPTCTHRPPSRTARTQLSPSGRWRPQADPAGRAGERRAALISRKHIISRNRSSAQRRNPSPRRAHPAGADKDRRERGTPPLPGTLPASDRPADPERRWGRCEEPPPGRPESPRALRRRLPAPTSPGPSSPGPGLGHRAWLPRACLSVCQPRPPSPGGGDTAREPRLDLDSQRVGAGARQEFLNTTTAATSTTTTALLLDLV